MKGYEAFEIYNACSCTLYGSGTFISTKTITNSSNLTSHAWAMMYRGHGKKRVGEQNARSQRTPAPYEKAQAFEGENARSQIIRP